MADRDLVTRYKGDTSDLERANATARGELGKVERSFAGAAGGIAKAGGAIAGAFVVDKVLEFGSASLGIATDLQESMSKVETVFGDSADAMVKFVKDANRLNLSDADAAALAGSLGNLAGQLGLAAGPAAELSKGVIELGADLGSFHNLDTADVVERIQKAMTGELDGVKQLAPALNAAMIEQRALADTGKKSAAELTAQEKAMATYALITEQSAAAIGDLDRTSESAANQQKNLTSKMEDAQAQLGAKMLPAWEGLLTFVLEDLLPGLQEFGRWFAEEVPPWYEQYVKPTVDAIVEVLRVAVELLAMLWATFGDTIIKHVQGTFSALMAIVQGAMRVLKGIIDLVLGIITGDWGRAWAGLVGIVGGVKDMVIGQIRLLKQGIETALNVLADILEAPFNAAKGAIASVIRSIAGLWNRTIGALEFKIPGWVPGMGNKGFSVPDINVGVGARMAPVTVVMPEGSSGYSMVTTLRQYQRAGGSTALNTVAIA